MKLFLSVFLIALLTTFDVFAQAANTQPAHFEKAGLAFDYPAEWKLLDNSTDDVKHFVVSPQGGLQEIARHHPKLPLMRHAIFKPRATRVTMLCLKRSPFRFTQPLRYRPQGKDSSWRAEVEGVQLLGVMNKRRVTSEIYSLRRHLLFVSLVYLRVDNDARSRRRGRSFGDAYISPVSLLGAR